MSIWAVLATGQSLTREQVELCLAHELKLVAVSDAWRIAPEADILVGSDAAWWRHYPEAKTQGGIEYCAAAEWDTCRVQRMGARFGINSGLLGIMAAVRHGAEDIILLGFDMHGSHFFGKHPAPFHNSTQVQFDSFQREFAEYHPEGVGIINCTPNTHLKAYPRHNLEQVLCLV